MTRYNRGIAGERAAVREAQREAARQLEEAACRRRPSLAESETSASADETESWLPGRFVVAKTPPPPSSITSKAELGRNVVRERDDVLPLAMHKCLDMDPIKKGSFFFMSSRYVEEVEDWCWFDEERRGATF
ncbi:uncharacterized protein F4807DRAFT_430179 [Annulohypoxylon truncatum]|uniref:uncharacterized protein n=1 Tax=Annulohypoxylon truncatum TaxID=327061 RepID=UPI0020075964|nr:uncharacterized protein F4807DRAFT_430179 [Annulohypoxylon truncatum]KAI1208577.1 hypothetical protein F4807DRAFT_430179 [Annulohypoxylon truncatum]